MRPAVDLTVQAIFSADSWDARVALIRQVPEDYGLAQQASLYAEIAKRVYVPHMTPGFAYVEWREEYSLTSIEQTYHRAHALTEGFSNTDAEDIARAIETEPGTLKIFRLLLGFLPQEFAGASRLVADDIGLPSVSVSRIRTIESGGTCSRDLAMCCAEVVTRAMDRQLFPPPSPGLTNKIEKPDTARGWETVREYAGQGVPFPVFLHQRHYGGAFRQLLDATSSARGDPLEVAVQQLFKDAGIGFIRTGPGNQTEVLARFGLTVRPVPDFVVFDEGDNLRAMLECKAANDGGTARDKAARFLALRGESIRLGGIPLFAILGGLGWTRTSDALGPVVRDTDGRTFTVANLPEMLTVTPFPALAT